MPLIFKQARAIIDKRTTVVCLDIHGAMVPVDEPFETMAGDFQRPPFHVHCRTLVGPRMAGFLSDARAEANDELQRRPKKQRRKGPGWEIGGKIPRPTTKNPPSGFSQQQEELAFVGRDAEAKSKRLFKPVKIPVPSPKAKAVVMQVPIWDKARASEGVKIWLIDLLARVPAGEEKDMLLAYCGRCHVQQISQLPTWVLDLARRMGIFPR